MADIRIIIQERYQRFIALDELNQRLDPTEDKLVFEVYGDKERLRILLPDEELDSWYDIMEESISSGKADAFVWPADELPYPLNPQLDVLALCVKQHARDKNTVLAKENIQASHPLSGYVAIVGKRENKDLLSRFERYDVKANWGKVALAGFGPGDHELITKKAAHQLETCDVIFYDDLVNEDYLQNFAAEKIYVGKRKGQHKFDQEIINELMYREALKGRNVVRIKGGDPLIFGRGAEEYHYLQSRMIQTTIIPGISSAFAAAAHAVIPFTERSLSSSVVLLSGHDIHKLRIPQADTLVFYMGASNQKELAREIIVQGWPDSTPVGVVYNVSNPGQQIYRGTLEDLMQNGSGLPSPSIIIVGKTAGYYSSSDKKWLYTGASIDEVKLRGHLVHTPLISIEAATLDENVKTVIENLSSYQRIIFTNRYAVNHFFDKLCELGMDVRNLHGIRIDSIGKTTSKALKSIGLVVPPLSENESVDGMLDMYGKERTSGENIIIPCSNQSSKVLQNGLYGMGNKVESLQVYAVVKNKAIIKQNLTRFQGLVFSSPATVEAFLEIYGEIPTHLQVKCVGALTKKAVHNALGNTSEVSSRRAV